MAGAAQGDRAGRDASGGPSGSRHSLRDRAVRRHPVRGAVAQGGGDPDQRARRRRNRARHRGLRALLEWRPDRDGGPVGAGSSRSDRHASGPAPSCPRFTPDRQLRRRRRPDLLRDRIWPTSTGARPITSIASSRARSRPTCRCRRRPNSSSSSTSRPRRRSASTCRRRCSPAPTR